MVYKVDDIKAAAKALADHVDGGTEVLPRK